MEDQKEIKKSSLNIYLLVILLVVIAVPYFFYHTNIETIGLSFFVIMFFYYLYLFFGLEKRFKLSKLNISETEVSNKLFTKIVSIVKTFLITDTVLVVIISPFLLILSFIGLMFCDQPGDENLCLSFPFLIGLYILLPIVSWLLYAQKIKTLKRMNLVFIFVLLSLLISLYLIFISSGLLSPTIGI